MFKYKRADRVAELLKEEVSKLLLFEIKSPELGFLTITKVKMTDDLRHAKIFFSVLGDSTAISLATETLNRLTGRIRKEIGHRLSLRYVPELQFLYDDNLAYSAHIQDILEKLHNTTNEKNE